MVRLCFFVIVRKANGRSMAGGRSTGSTAGVVGFVNAGGGWFFSPVGRDAMGYAGVAKAGDEDGIGSVVLFVALNRGAGGRGVMTESRSSILRIRILISQRIEQVQFHTLMVNLRRSPIVYSFVKIREENASMIKGDPCTCLVEGGSARGLIPAVN